MLEARCILKYAEFHILQARPILNAILQRHERQPEACGRTFAHQPNRHVLVHRELGPNADRQPTVHNIQFTVRIGLHIRIGQKHAAQLIEHQIHNTDCTALKARLRIPGILIEFLIDEARIATERELRPNQHRGRKQSERIQLNRTGHSGQTRFTIFGR